MLGALQATRLEPGMRRHPCGDLEGSREVSERQTALGRDLMKRYILAKVPCQQLFRPFLLPRRQSAAVRRLAGPHPAVGEREVRPEAEHDVVDQRLAHAFGLLQGTYDQP